MELGDIYGLFSKDSDTPSRALAVNVERVIGCEVDFVGVAPQGFAYEDKVGLVVSQVSFEFFKFITVQSPSIPLNNF